MPHSGPIFAPTLKVMSSTRRPSVHRARRRLPAWVPAPLILIAIFGLLFGLRSLDMLSPVPSAKAAPSASPTFQPNVTPGPTVGRHVDNVVGEHIPSNERHSGYTTRPAVTGPHWAQPDGPVPWGISTRQLPDEATVHNLEHGGVYIAYKGLDDAELADLRTFVRTQMGGKFKKIVMAPYAEMDAKITVAAWNWIMPLPSYQKSQILAFLIQHYENSEAPEARAR